MPAKQAKYYVFTINNPQASDYTCVDEATTRGASYLIYGREVGESGTPHLQGYIEYPDRRTINGVRQFLGGRAHCEIRRGTQSEAVEYCKKDGNWVEFGTAAVSQQGKRTDLDTALEPLASGKCRLDDWVEANPKYFVQYRNGIRDLALHVASKKPRIAARVIYIWGAPGTGKSRWAHAICPESTWVYGGKGWFDGYTDQRVAIFDDFDFDLEPGTLLKLLDIYKCQLPIKGGFTFWNPETIIITSNYELDSLCIGKRLNLDAIKRRIHVTRRVDQLGELDGVSVEEINSN